MGPHPCLCRSPVRIPINRRRARRRDRPLCSVALDFLLDQRVELNAFASDELVQWIEGKLEEHGVSKVIPDEDCLADVYRRAQERAFVQQKIDAALDEAGDLGEVEIPDNLRTEVEDRLSEDTAATWDSIVRDIAEQKFEDDDVGDDE